MAVIQIKAKTKDSDPVTVNFDFGNDDNEFVSKFGLPVVASHARANMKLTVQDLIRAGIEKGDSQAAIQKATDELKFGVKRKGKSRAEKVAEQMSALSDEEKKALLARLTATGGSAKTEARATR